MDTDRNGYVDLDEFTDYVINADRHKNRGHGGGGHSRVIDAAEVGGANGRSPSPARQHSLTVSGRARVSPARRSPQQASSYMRSLKKQQSSSCSSPSASASAVTPSARDLVFLREVSSKLKQASVFASGQQDAARLFGKYDVNHDGCLSQEELAIALRKQVGGLDDNDLRMLWSVLDVNDDGDIDVDEFVNFVQRADFGAALLRGRVELADIHVAHVEATKEMCAHKIVHISCRDSRSKIVRYTTDGRDPDPHEEEEGQSTRVYEGPFRVDDDRKVLRVKAVAYAQGVQPSYVSVGDIRWDRALAHVPLLKTKNSFRVEAATQAQRASEGKGGEFTHSPGGGGGMQGGQSPVASPAPRPRILPGQLVVIVKRGEALKNVESFMHKMDPYVKVKMRWGNAGGAHGGDWQVTAPAHSMHKNPVWGMEKHGSMMVYPFKGCR